MLPLVIVIVIVGLAVFFQARRAKRRLHELASILSNAEVTGAFNARLKGLFHSRPAKLWFQPGSRYSGSTISFRVRSKGLGSTIAKALRLGNPVEVGVPDLDSRFAFSSSEPERLARWILSSDEPRRGIPRLLDERHVSLLTLRDGSLHAEIEGYSDEQASPEFAGPVLDSLELLARSTEGA